MCDPQENSDDAPRWQSLPRNDRRVVGVLVEKAKTTPENYPLSLNTLMNGCNQKSNRFPQMQLGEGEAEESLDRLRGLGATAQVEGNGRVDKHRHLLYQWLGVDKVELAVMAELLLRGAQTLGELRSRAARMEPIPGISELRPIVEGLRQKGLLIYLTAPGRGAVVTHALYEARELEKLRAEHGHVETGDVETGNPAAGNPATGEPVSPVLSAAAAVAPAVADRSVPAQSSDSELQALRTEVTSLQEQVGSLRAEVDELKQQLGV